MMSIIRVEEPHDLPIHVGEYLRLKKGKVVQIVIEVGIRSTEEMGVRSVTYMVRTEYPGQQKNYNGFHETCPKWRPLNDYVIIGKERKVETVMTEVNNLYQVKDTEEFGTKIAVNSQGDFVLEMKDGAGTVKAFKEDLLEEVVPYTVSVRKVTSDPNDDKHVHWQVTPGSLNKADVLIDDKGTRYCVLCLDTKHRRPIPPVKGLRRIVTEELKL